MNTTVENQIEEFKRTFSKCTVGWQWCCLKDAVQFDALCIHTFTLTACISLRCLSFLQHYKDILFACLFAHCKLPDGWWLIEESVEWLLDMWGTMKHVRLVTDENATRFISIDSLCLLLGYESKFPSNNLNEKSTRSNLHHGIFTTIFTQQFSAKVILST